jgi:uncharacterized protein (DUF697 family)
MERKDRADQMIKSHTLWSMGAGLIPVPLLDMAAVTAVQIDLLQQLAKLYGVDFSLSKGKTFVSGLTGGAVARKGASMVKALPGVGSVVGGLSMSVLSGASTYAVGQVAIKHLESSQDFLNVDLNWAKAAYEKAFARGKEVVEKFKAEGRASHDTFHSLRKLAELRDAGVISEQDFETKKQELLFRV